MSAREWPCAVHSIVRECGCQITRGSPNGEPLNARFVVFCALLAGVHVLDAVALVLEGRAVGTLEIHPAALLAIVLGRLLAGLFAEVDVADGPEPGVICDDERDRADVPRRVRRDEGRPGRVATVRSARVEDRAGRVVD